jgi:hypothetical protein
MRPGNMGKPGPAVKALGVHLITSAKARLSKRPRCWYMARSGFSFHEPSAP